MPTVPGGRITLRFQIQGVELKPVAADGGPVAYIRFQTLTGQRAANKIVFGIDADGRRYGSGPFTGDFGWRQEEVSAVAPPHAKRFSVFLGIKPAEGIARFGDIWVETQPGQSSSRGDLPLERRFETIDLQPYVNHDFDGDMGVAPGGPPPEEFQRDYCDLPVVDLSHVKPGRHTAGPIPFDIDRAVVLRSFRRPPPTLPLKVTGIEVARRVGSLYFVYARPIQMGAQEYWRYVIHYADGRSVEVVPVNDIADLHYREPFFLPSNDTVEPAVRMTQEVDGVGHVQRWINRRPDVPVTSLDFRSMDAGQPVLLAITAGIR